MSDDRWIDVAEKAPEKPQPCRICRGRGKQVVDGKHVRCAGCNGRGRAYPPTLQDEVKGTEA